MTRTQKKVLWQYYSLVWLFSAGGMQIISAVYVTFLSSYGLNNFWMNAINAIFFLTRFVCEIPTGAFADIFGRKTSFVVSCGLLSISMFWYGCSSTIPQFMIAEVIGAIGATFCSGAFQSWFVDSLKYEGYDGPLTKLFVIESWVAQAGAVVGGIAGAYLSVINMSLPWFVGGSSLLVIALIAQISMREDYHVRRKLSWKTGFSSLREVTATSVRYGLQDRTVRFILLLTFLQIFALMPLNMYWPLYFKDLGLAQAHLGYIIAGCQVAVGIGAFVAVRLKVQNREKGLMLSTQLFIGVMIIIAAVASGFPLVLLAFLLHEVGRGLWVPLKDSYLQQDIPSSERATIVSFCSAAPNIGGVIGLLVSGAIASLAGISITWLVFGSLLAVGVLVVAWNGRR